MTSFVKAFSEITDADKSIIGGKAANLAKMLQAGLPVPNGIAVGLSAFDDTNHLHEDAKRYILQTIDTNTLYAVRSSALAEDAEGASWAGQFETFLDTAATNVIAKIEECHTSTKNRAVAYGSDKDGGDNFNIAVVVQAMVKPEYAGVLFTKDPVSGADTPVTEYVAGLGEELVSGRADPKRIVLDETTDDAPFDVGQLAQLASKVETLFGVPQDIEWAWANGQIWLVQARPITTAQRARSGNYLGEPNDLFYWGPSRAKPMYMSDFMAAAEQFLLSMAANPKMPSPPKTVVLFQDEKMVWLNNAQAFADFTEQTFEAYVKQNRLTQDIAAWRAAIDKLPSLKGQPLKVALVQAWVYTEFAEFSLYGAEAALLKKLGRFEAPTRQEIWRTFTVPDKPTFLAIIDEELASNKDPNAMAQKYSWIEDGYEGLANSALSYFEKRLTVVGDSLPQPLNLATKRQTLAHELELTDDELSALNLARQLAEFMDDRKAWMMQTRKLITENVGSIEYGWSFNNGKAALIEKDAAHELWQRYIDFKASNSAVSGIVASNGGRHFINGEVVVVGNPNETVADSMIIVVPSTSPSYVPLMRKAKALITDHGGMMSHAAIVAREFNLPCIVGTKQATKILKNGDKVVLDLVKGEVNK